MVIETASKTYLVIGYLKQDEDKDVYLCEHTLDNKQYVIISIKNQALILKTMEFLHEQVSNTAFSDLVECFVYQERLHLTFTCQKGEMLQEKIQGEYSSLEERLEIEKKLLEKLILLSMPYYFQSQCLRPEHIYVTRSLDISFLYSIEDLISYDSYTIRDVQEGVKIVSELLFQEELKKEVLLPMKTFLDDLSKPLYQNCLEIYKDYIQAYKQILALSKANMEMPKTWAFRFWEKLKKLFKPLKKLVVIAMLVAGLLYMIWTINQASQPALSSSLIDQIGTLKIK